MSNSGRRRHLICYDIANPRRLGKVARLCERTGIRIQYSVFEAHLSESELRAFERKLRELIDQRLDDVRIYGMHENRTITTIGDRRRDIAGVHLFAPGSGSDE